MARHAVAASAAGLAPSLTQAAARLPLPVQPVGPVAADVPAYAAAYRRYRALFEALTPLF
jgi:sugar (pentulose or hexulose) kinase